MKSLIKSAVAVATHLASSIDTEQLSTAVVSAVVQGKDRKGILAAVLAAAPAIFSHPEYADLLKAALGFLDAAQAIHAKATAAAPA